MNPEARAQCGFVVEMKGLGDTKISFRPNTSEIHACRDTDEIGFDLIDSATDSHTLCVLGVQRGQRWLKDGTVALSPTTPTTFIVGAIDLDAGRKVRPGPALALRASRKDAAAVLALPDPDAGH